MSESKVREAMMQAARALRSKQRQAAAKAAPAQTEAPPEAAAEVAPHSATAQALANSQILDSYRDLVATSARTYGQLDKDDPIRPELLAAITHARQAWNQFLFEGADGLADQIGDLPYQQPAKQPSVELVPFKPSGEMVTVTPRRKYPDEAALVRYVRRRRQLHRWPDEATLVRYLRKRRERGPIYPDESGISRYLQRRREAV